MEQATQTTVNPRVIDELNRTINLDYDAIRAYDSALDRLLSDSSRKRLEGFREDHIRHTQRLTALVGSYGGKPASRSSTRAVLSQDRVMIGNIVGDQGVLKAMNANERETRDHYRRTLETLTEYPEICQVLRENYADEQRHQRWIEQALKSM